MTPRASRRVAAQASAVAYVTWLLAAGDRQLSAAHGCLAAGRRAIANAGLQREHRRHSLLPTPRGHGGIIYPARGTGQHVTAAMAAARRRPAPPGRPLPASPPTFNHQPLAAIGAEQKAVAGRRRRHGRAR